MVTAWKPAESGAGWILRLQETAGRASVVRIDFNEKVRVTRTNLLEAVTGKSRVTQCHAFSLHRHGIETLLLEK